MPQYHPSAEQECRDVLAQGGRDIKICFGMMLKRHLAIRDGTEVLTASELLPASGPDLTKLYEVTYSYNLHARLTAIYASKDEGVTQYCSFRQSRRKDSKVTKVSGGLSGSV